MHNSITLLLLKYIYFFYCQVLSLESKLPITSARIWEKTKTQVPVQCYDHLEIVVFFCVLLRRREFILTILNQSLNIHSGITHHVPTRWFWPDVARVARLNLSRSWRPYIFCKSTKSDVIFPKTKRFHTPRIYQSLSNLQSQLVVACP